MSGFNHKESDLVELERLRRENLKLKNLLLRHGIEWQVKESTDNLLPSKNGPDDFFKFRVEEKIALFRRLFNGRQDVYPLRWQSAVGKSGYSPACRNEWKRGTCQKPIGKCTDCAARELLPVTDQVVYDHLTGTHTIGVYPLLPDNTCNFLAVDFDGSEWQEDARAFFYSCRDMRVPAAIEISRSGDGAHVWIFFSEPVMASEARKLGEILLNYTCEQLRLLSLASYDRFFPNQNTMPKGGFGNLIALPLQKQRRKMGFTVFVDENFKPYDDQWSFLFGLGLLSRQDMDNIISQSGDSREFTEILPCAVKESEPWKRKKKYPEKLKEPLPAKITLVIANFIFIERDIIPLSLCSRLLNLAVFQNPEFYKAQAMRMSVWNKPRLICCAENFPQHIALPRGCLDDVLALLKENDIQVEIQDERFSGDSIEIDFAGKLLPLQEQALDKIVSHDIGVLCAPTAFGKTVVAAALIAVRKRRTLVLVHRTELLRQWQERLSVFLTITKAEIGLLGGGRKTDGGAVDIAVLQSLVRHSELREFLDSYGHIIVDECHHLSAFSFESILKQSCARYILGLTATPVRRDGHHPIIFMQCGPIRHDAGKKGGLDLCQTVLYQELPFVNVSDDIAVQEYFRQISINEKRNEIIVGDILDSYKNGRKILVLTERMDHLLLLQNYLDDIKGCFCLHGRLTAKQRIRVMEELDNKMTGNQPLIILATGRFIGEGFDYPPLDTMILAMPISWKGVLQQYAGRLHREYATKTDIRIYDYVEVNIPRSVRMWQKRQKGYKAMGYELESVSAEETLGKKF